MRERGEGELGAGRRHRVGLGEAEQRGDRPRTRRRREPERLLEQQLGARVAAALVPGVPERLAAPEVLLDDDLDRSPGRDLGEQLLGPRRREAVTRPLERGDRRLHRRVDRRARVRGDACCERRRGEPVVGDEHEREVETLDEARVRPLREPARELGGDPTALSRAARDGRQRLDQRRDQRSGGAADGARREVVAERVVRRDERDHRGEAVERQRRLREPRLRGARRLHRTGRRDPSQLLARLDLPQLLGGVLEGRLSARARGRSRRGRRSRRRARA